MQHEEPAAHLHRRVPGRGGIEPGVVDRIEIDHGPILRDANGLDLLHFDADIEHRCARQRVDDDLSGLFVDQWNQNLDLFDLFLPDLFVFPILL